jgi:hypothetical protein
VDKALDAAIGFVIGKAKALFAKLFGKKDDKAGNAAALDVTVPFQMGSAGHQLSTVVGPSGLQIRMASGRADYLRILITGATKALSARPNPSADDKDLLSRLRALSTELHDLEETRVASLDVGGAEGTAIRDGITHRLTEIAQLLSAIGQAFGITDLEHLTHPSQYVGHLLGPNRYALLPEYAVAKRGRFYGGYRTNVDTWVSGEIGKSPTPGYWQDAIDKKFYPVSIAPTIDHKEPVAKHWNQLSGNDEAQNERADWYSDTSNFQLATGPNNRSEGAKGEANMVNEVGIKFRGPNE